MYNVISQDFSDEFIILNRNYAFYCYIREKNEIRIIPILV